MNLKTPENQAQSREVAEALLPQVELTERLGPLFWKKLRGLVMALGASVIASLMGAAPAYLRHIPIAQFTFTNFLLISMLSFTIIFHQERGIPDCKGSAWFIAGRCLVGGLGGVLRYWSLVELEYGDAVALSGLLPAFAAITGRIMWRDRITLPTIIATLTGIVGVGLVAQPGFLFSEGKGYGYRIFIGLGSYLTAAIAYSFMRGVDRTISKLLIPGFLSFTISIYSIAFFFIKSEPLVSPGCYTDRLIIIAVVVAGIAVLVLMNYALTIEQTGPVTLVRTTDVFFAYIVQVVLFGKTPNSLSIAGGFLIFSCTVIVTLDKIFLQSIPFFRRCQI